MVIYGSRSTHLTTERVPQLCCPNCKNKGSVRASIYSTHAHVFWIPLFPAGRTGIFECGECHATFKKKDLDAASKERYKNFNRSVKTPIWKFSGLAVIALLLAFGFYGSKQKEEKVAEWIQHPQVHDRYTFKTETNYYSTFKVVQVFEDSVYVRYNDFETDKLSGIRKLEKASNYSEMVYMLKGEELQEMHKKGLIKDIDR